MTTPNNESFEVLADLAQRYLLGDLDAAQFARFEAMILANDETAQALIEFLRQAGMMRVVFNEPRQFVHRIGEIDREEYLALLQTLSPSEEPQPVHFLGPIDALRPIWRQWPVVASASIAAVLALALTLVLIFNGPTPDTQTAAHMAITPNQPDPATPAPVCVATLTATHRAQWAEGALAPGAGLHPGDRLTLTAGFAEITTARGAVALLEAPATIELTDNDNALHLHAGKLLGLCYTKSSKGFTVRTDHADITDLSTQFGVQVDENHITTTVFNGRVELTTPDGKAQPITTNQTLLLSFSGGERSQVIENRLAGGFETLLANPMADSIAGLQPRLEGSGVEWNGIAFGDLRFKHRVSENVQVFLERRGVLLEQDLNVDLNPDVPVYADQLPSASIPAGKQVDVYLLHFDPYKQYAVTDLALHFDRPILGVITAAGKLYETDALLGRASVGYPDKEITRDLYAGRGLEIVGSALDDQVSIDGQTIHLRLGLRDYIDQVRVLVEAAPETRH